MQVALARANSKYAWLRASKEQGVARRIQIAMITDVSHDAYHQLINLPFIEADSIPASEIQVMVGLSMVGKITNIAIPAGFAQ